MKSENTFSFAPLFRWVRRSAVVLLGTLLVLLLHAPLRAGAQGCPSLDTGDFTATLIAANSDCHTPARLTVTYRNAVAGFSAMAYSVSKNRTNYSTPVVTPRPGLPAVLPLDGWNEGEPIYIRAVATCGTRKLTVVLPKIVYHVKEAADVQATATITPAGGCEATGGAVSVHLSGVSGFSKAEFKLEKDGATPRHPSVPVGNLTARKPYEETLFFNLAPGRYTLRVRAVPDCVPATPGEGWKDGAYEWEQPVDVEHFGVTATTIPTRGNCPGGVVIGASKVVGIARLKYELWKKGGMRAGTPPLQTANVVYPAFAHTFTGLPLGDYEVRATATDCDATATGSFVITQGELVHPKVSIIRHTYAGCAAGRLQVQLDGTTAACPASYRLTPTAGGTPKVLTDVATETAEFSSLAAGTYTLTTTYGGQTINTPVEIKTVSPGVLKIKPTLAETYCSPTGAMEVTLVDGTLDESATLELSLDGNPVRSINLNAGETSKTIEGLLPGGYNVTLRTECGAKVSTQTAIGTKNAPNMEISTGDAHFDYCQTPLKFKKEVRISLSNVDFSSSEEEAKAQLAEMFSGAVYEIRDTLGKLLSSDVIPIEDILKKEFYGELNFNVQYPVTDSYIKFSLRMPCGFPTIEGSEYTAAIENYSGNHSSVVKFPLIVETVRTDCNQFRLTLKHRDYVANRSPHTVRLVDRATGLTVEEKYSTEFYDDFVFENIPAGDYYYEFWGDCPNAPHHRSADIKVSNKNQYGLYTQGAKGCEKLGYIRVDFNLGESSTTCKYTLYNEAGTLIREETHSGNYFTFNDIPPGRYKVKVEPALNPGDCPVDPFTEDIYIYNGGKDYDYTLGLAPAEEIKNPTATLGPITSNTNTLSFDYYNTPGEYTLKLTSDSGAPITKTVTIPNDGASKNTVHVTFENLPDKVSLHFTGGSCAFSDVRDYNLVKLATHKDERDEYLDIYDLKTSLAVPGCRKASAKLHFKLLEKGLPQRRTALVIKKRVSYQQLTIDSIASPNIITDWENKAGEDPSLYGFYYYYDGKLILSLDGIIEPQSSSTLTANVWAGNTPPGEKGAIVVSKGNLGTNEHLHVRITETGSGRQLYDETISGAEYEHEFPLSPGTYTVNYEPLDGCFAGQEYEKRIEVPRGEYKFYAQRNKMLCANDGVITVVAKEGYGVVDQVNYEIIPDNGSPSIHGQTSTPYIAKEFPGLEKGCYTIKATAIVLRGFDGHPHSYEAENRECLATSYAEPLSVRNAPELSSPASNECGTGGAIGLEINGSRKANVKVFMTDSPAGPVNPRQELFQDNNGNWGKNLAPGAYKLFVTDGCMDIIVPNATVLQTENKASVKTNNQCIDIDIYAANSNKLNFGYQIDLKDYPEHLRKKIATLIETQVVAPNSAPDESNWHQYVHNDNNNSLYNYYSSATRFNISEGFDILYRFRGCPGSMKRYHQVKGANKLCNPFNISIDPKTTTCDKTGYILDRYDTGRPYRIRVTRIEDNQVVYNQVKTFTYNPDFPHQLKNEIILPNTSSYSFEITSVDEPMSVYTTSYYRENKGPNYDVYGIHNITCTTARYQFTWATGGCHKKQWMIIRDKATGTEVARLHQWYENDNPQFTVTEYNFERNKTYSMEIYDEANVLIATDDWTPRYNLAERFVYDDFNLDNLCDADAPKTISPANGLSNIYVEWDEAQGARLYGEVKKVIVRSNDTGKTFQARYLEESSVKVRPSTGKKDHPILKVSNWSELSSSGEVLKQNTSPSLEPGEYTLEVYTSCGTKTSTFNIAYKAPAESDVKLTNVQLECDGKIKFTPAGTASLPNSTDPVNFSTYRIEGDDYTTYNWGDEGETYKPSGIVYYKLNLPDGQTCERRLYYNYASEPLAFDKSSTVSFFCSGADKGEINVGLKGGHPPYTYQLRTLDGLLVEKKTAPGVVTFEQGVLGSRYRIEATDDCGLTHIHQDVLLQDPAAIAGNMKSRVSYCEGAQGRLEAITFPGATYIWTRPDGSQSHDKVITFPATAANAGKYTVNIQLNSCNATINGEYRVQVAQLSESTGAHTDRTCAGQSTIFSPEKPEAMLDGEEVDEERLKFQWQYTKTPNDETSWKPIFGATDASVEYVAAYPGTYYLRRTTQLGECSAIGGVCTLTVDPGITVTMSAGERRVVIDHKNPFLLTAGIVSGPAARTYQWQRSLDGKQWSNIAGATEVTYTETQRLSSVVYYRRIVRSGTCETKGEPITVVFKRRYPAMINPQVRQRVDQHW